MDPSEVKILNVVGDEKYSVCHTCYLNQNYLIGSLIGRRLAVPCFEPLAFDFEHYLVLI